jgi:Na+/proline symporter
VTQGAGGALAPLDWIVVGAYLALVIGAGLPIARRARGSIENFFLSGRRLPWWLAGTSMAATSFATDTPLVVTGWTRAGGIAGNWRWWAYVVGTLLVVVLFSRLWRRSAVVTDVEFIELRYAGRPARVLRAFKGCYQVLFLHCFVLGWVILAMTKVLVVLFGWEGRPPVMIGGLAVPVEWLAMSCCALVALLYSEFAGLWGVVVTDLVQFFLALVGALALLFAVAEGFGGLGGLADALRDAPETVGALSLVPSAPVGGWAHPGTWGAEIWSLVVFLGVVWFANKNADGSGIMVQRMLACRDEGQAMRATLWYAIANFALRPWPWILVALASLLVLPRVAIESPAAGTVVSVGADTVLVDAGGAGLLPVSLADDGAGSAPDWRPQPRVAPGDRVEAGQVLAATDDERAYPVMMRRYLPAGLLGLVVASFLAAFMSTVDSHVNLASAYLVHDVYKRFVRGDAPPAHYVRVARLVGPAVMLAGMAFAAGSSSVRAMFDVFTTLFGGVGPIYLLRWLWWRINAWSEIAALLTSAAATLLLQVWPGLALPLLPPGLQMDGRPTFAGALLCVVSASLVVSLTVTLLTPPVPRAHLAAFHARVSPPGRWGALRGRPRSARGPLAVLAAWLLGAAALFTCILLPGTLLGGVSGGLVVLLILAAAATLLGVCRLAEDRHPGPDHR